MSHHVLHVTADGHLPVLLDLVAAPGRTVVFTRTKHRAKKLARQLNGSGVPAVELHGNLSQNARTRTMDAFHSGAARTLVATDIAARGIHVDDVALVIHADPPVEHKAYMHRSGRTARAGASGTVITLMTDDQVRDVRDLTRKAGVNPTTTRVTSDAPAAAGARPRRALLRGRLRPAGVRPAARQGGGRRPRSPAVGGGRGGRSGRRPRTGRAPLATAGGSVRGAGQVGRSGGRRSGRPASARRPRRARPARPPPSPRARAAAPADRADRARVAGYGHLRHELVRAGVVAGGARAGRRPVRRARCSSCSSRPSWPWRSTRSGGCCASASPSCTSSATPASACSRGRRFTGFVLRGDMSGHAVTVGPARGLGRVLTTWAGYPAPAVVGRGRGRGSPCAAGPRRCSPASSRCSSPPPCGSAPGSPPSSSASPLVAAGALWWAGPPQLQAQVVVAVGLVLIVGAWRHLGAVLAAPRPRGRATPGCWPG